jgi:transglutaminase-like putative cysteine protease
MNRSAAAAAARRAGEPVSRLVVALLVLIVLLQTAVAPAKELPPLAAPPLGERWFGISFNGERVGFARIDISATPTGYRIDTDGSVKMLVLGFGREVSSRESYLVGKDLALQSFTVEQTLDKSPMRVSGSMTAKGVRLQVESGGERKEKLLKAKGPVYPSPLLNLVPLRQGYVTGRKYRLHMLDVEALKLKEVKVTALGSEPGGDGRELYRLENDLYPVANEIWLDQAGNTVKESVRRDLILTVAEEEATIRRFLLTAAVSRQDLALDFSLVRTAVPIQQPAALQRLVVDLTGLPAGFVVPAGAGQEVTTGANGAVRFIVFRSNGTPPAAAAGLAELAPYLAAGDRLPVDHPRLRTLAAEIVGQAKEPRQAISALNRWVADTVSEAVIDSHSPLETLESKQGNCQAHARLYTTLARAAGIPTRFVSGLVYLPGKGFLYHSWAESHAGDWLAVDPTFGQLPADVTHLKLVEGDTPDDLGKLAAFVGLLGATVIEQK